ncbi:MAG: tetratricopeptide repeat protein [Kiritimatiellia bacterium]
MSFREMALVNLAVCHAQIGNGTKSKQYYQQALAEFPKSALAQMAL